MGENMELLQAQAHLWNHTFKYINSMSLRCVVQLGIPDIIHSHGQPMSLSNLVAALHIQPSKAQSLGRLMRLLVHSGFFAQTRGENEQEAKFSLTPPSRILLLQDKTFDTTDFVCLILSQTMMAPWETMSNWFRSEDQEHSTAFEMTYMKTIWDYIAHEPDFGNLFHQALAFDSQLIGKVVTNKCRGMLEGLTSLVDVGGGAGTMAKAIVEAFPHITCTVFDLPQVIAKYQQTTKNLSFIEGDMFEAIPLANTVMLKFVLHDWNDEDSIQILKNCRDVIPSRAEGGKVIIIEMVMETQIEKESVETQLCLDVFMMTNFTGRERNEREWKNLFLAAGFSDYKIIPILGLRSFIEVYP